MLFDYTDYSESFANFINSSQNKNVTILIHRNADADCIGASLTVCSFLESLGYNCLVISSNNYNRNFNWMPDITKMVVFDSLFKNTAINHIEKSDIVFCLDFSQKTRVNQEIFDLVANKNICVIDHHLDQPDFEAVKLLNSEASSTCEIIYEILNLKYKSSITKNIATYLYSGIISDTGHFVTQNTKYRVYEIAGELMKDFDLSVYQINKDLFGSNRFSRIRFLGHVLNKCLMLVPNYKISYIKLSKADTERFSLRQGETCGIVDYGLSIKHIVVTALFNEIDKNNIHISFRSIGDFPVSEFSKEYFEGGGHRNAAGGKSNLTLDETINKFVECMVKYIDANDCYNSLKFNN